MAAGALAAVSAAVVASLFGVAGTVIGAAVASVVSTVGAALYVEYLAALTTMTNAANSLILAEYDYQMRQVEYNRITAKQ